MGKDDKIDCHTGAQPIVDIVKKGIKPFDGGGKVWDKRHMSSRGWLRVKMSDGACISAARHNGRNRENHKCHTESH